MLAENKWPMWDSVIVERKWTKIELQIMEKWKDWKKGDIWEVIDGWSWWDVQKERNEEFKDQKAMNEAMFGFGWNQWLKDTESYSEWYCCTLATALFPLPLLFPLFHNIIHMSLYYWVLSFCCNLHNVAYLKW